MQMKKISDSTIRRLSKYYRTLSSQIEKGVSTISSNEIAQLNSITSAQVRKDLSFFGTFGKRGLGYNTEQLKDQIANILGLKKEWRVGLVGFGNIGRALLRYDEFKKQGFNIKAIFDNDPTKFGQQIDDLKVDKIEDACNVVAKEKIEIIIVAAPSQFAQTIVEQFIEYGIKAFLNFAPISLKVPDDVLVKNENMSIELEALSYFLFNK
jgi:redox-sensing transcriptional repressor